MAVAPWLGALTFLPQIQADLVAYGAAMRPESELRFPRCPPKTYGKRPETSQFEGKPW